MIELRPEENQVVVGTNGDLLSASLTADDVHWTSGEAPAEPFRANAKIRYRATEVPLPSYPYRTSVSAWISTLPRAVCDSWAGGGVYIGDEVIGGGTIERPN